MLGVDDEAPIVASLTALDALTSVNQAVGDADTAASANDGRNMSALK